MIVPGGSLGFDVSHHERLDVPGDGTQVRALHIALNVKRGGDVVVGDVGGAHAALNRRQVSQKLRVVMPGATIGV